MVLDFAQPGKAPAARILLANASQIAVCAEILRKTKKNPAGA